MPGDRGTKIEPAQPKHVPVDPVFVNNQFGRECWRPSRKPSSASRRRRRT